MKEKEIEKRAIQVKERHYFQNYESMPMWINHWHQIQAVLKIKKNNVLEIGPGNGLVSYFLGK